MHRSIGTFIKGHEPISEHPVLFDALNPNFQMDKFLPYLFHLFVKNVLLLRACERIKWNTLIRVTLGLWVLALTSVLLLHLQCTKWG